MRPFRFTIASLIGVVGFVALAAASLRAATPAWDRWLFGGTLLVLLTSVLLAIHRTGRKRAFWLGFSLFGWATLGASLVPTIAARLPTTRALQRLDELRPEGLAKVDFDRDGFADLFVVNSSTGATEAGRSWALAMKNAVPWDASRRSTENIIAIGHSLVTLMLAFAGGLLSRTLSHPSPIPRISIPQPRDPE